jgi:hypothetical protein
MSIICGDCTTVCPMAPFFPERPPTVAQCWWYACGVTMYHTLGLADWTLSEAWPAYISPNNRHIYDIPAHSFM